MRWSRYNRKVVIKRKAVINKSAIIKCASENNVPPATFIKPGVVCYCANEETTLVIYLELTL